MCTAQYGMLIKHYYRKAGIQLPDVKRIDSETPKEDYTGNIVIAPPGAEAHRG